MGTSHEKLRPRRRCPGALLGILLMAGCTAEPSSLAAQPPAAHSLAGPLTSPLAGPLAQPSAQIGEQVFAVGYGRIAEIYLNPVDMGQLTTDGLRGLAKMDGSLAVERSASIVRVSSNGLPLGEFTAPPANDAGGWASVTAQAIERVRLTSTPLRQASSEEIYQTVFDAIMGDLDAYSRYTSAQRAGGERAQREGYGGVGMGVEFVGGKFVINDLLGHAPATRAGLKASEVITAIDGDATGTMILQDVRDRLRGPSGTLVLVTVESASGTQSRRVALRRERVIPNTVTSSIDNGVAVISIERFNAATSLNVREAIDVARTQMGRKAEGFVLDLRGNPGGLLDQAVAVADLFIPQGRIITTAGRHPDSIQQFDATLDDQTDGLPLVVLMDGRSASASEIVAAALQDTGRAVVVGASSFGKGSVQTVTRLPNDGELFLTWSRIYAPSGYTLHRQGVTPTICTSKDASDPDAVIGDLRQGHLGMPATLASWRAAAPDDETALHQLRDACPWKTHEADLDLRVAKRLLADQSLYQRALQLSTTLLAER
ncbi:S41 family peptidase [Skermanella stibiiresistens]|nr:S41 family peptidase [Skermanella stibiiresistens]